MRDITARSLDATNAQQLPGMLDASLPTMAAGMVQMDLHSVNKTTTNS